jgi:hypothetical protein
MNAVELLESLSDKGVIVSFDGTNIRVRGLVNVITSELTGEMRRLKPELIELLTPSRDGTDLQRLAYDIRETQLVAMCRAKAVELQVWLTAHFDEHMSTDPLGLPEWMSSLAEFLVIDRGQLRNVFHYVGCIHDSGSCPDDAPVNCTACESHDE